MVMDQQISGCGKHLQQGLPLFNAPFDRAAHPAEPVEQTGRGFRVAVDLPVAAQLTAAAFVADESDHVLNRVAEEQADLMWETRLRDDEMCIRDRVTDATEFCQVPQPSGANSGAMPLPIAASTLLLMSSTAPNAPFSQP